MAQEKNYTLIVGMGKTGNAIADFLNAQGENIVITDLDASKTNETEIFIKKGIKAEIGFHNIKSFKNARRIIVSPGVPLTLNELKEARKAGIPITGELDIISELIDIPILAITGTNGKTTVTTLLGDMLKASGLNPFVCGNIGTPIINYLSNNKKADIIVAEISSFQLDTANKFQPDIAVLLNIAEDHLDRYKSFDDYAESKWSIFKNQTKNQYAIINKQINNIDKKTENIKSEILYFNEQNNTNGNEYNAIINSDHINIKGSNIDLTKSKLKGTHNKENIAAASLATLAAKGSINGIKKGLENFTPLPHRVEFVDSINGIDFYNDSKATNPDAVKRAIEYFDQNILLIMGGQEKDTDFACLKTAMGTKIKNLIVMGDAKDKIADTFSNICKIIHADSMKDAVTIAYKNGEAGDIILLSPGCASFDMYNSYSQRGFDFINKTRKLKQEGLQN